MAWLRGGATGALIVLSTLVVFTLMLLPAMAKQVLPAGAPRLYCDQALNFLATGWVAMNNAWLSAAASVPWQVCGLEGLMPHRSYLVSINHQCWADILILQRIFHHRIPFLRPFLKRELRPASALGLAWRVLDFPFVRCNSESDAGHGDLATTRSACQKYKCTPTAVLGFAEGTRFTAGRHASQRSPYRHLLMPKVNGLGVALATMGEQFDALLDVTIVYPDGAPRLWDLMCGRAGAICVNVRRRRVPSGVVGGDLAGDQAYRRRVRAWLADQWTEKDRLIDARLAAHRAGREPRAG